MILWEICIIFLHIMCITESRTIATSDAASDMDPLLSSVSSVVPQESTGQPHIITGREVTDGYFRDKVHIIQEQQRETTDGNGGNGCKSVLFAGA
jgi:hypothetical protein